MMPPLPYHTEMLTIGPSLVSHDLLVPVISSCLYFLTLFGCWYLLSFSADVLLKRGSWFSTATLLWRTLPDWNKICTVVTEDVYATHTCVVSTLFHLTPDGSTLHSTVIWSTTTVDDALAVFRDWWYDWPVTIGNVNVNQNFLVVAKIADC